MPKLFKFEKIILASMIEMLGDNLEEIGWNYGIAKSLQNGGTIEQAKSMFEVAPTIGYSIEITGWEVRV